MELRRELLSFPLEDGGIEIVDLVLERSHRLDSEEAAALAGPAKGWSSALRQKLESLLLLENDTAALLRQNARFGRLRTHLPSPTTSTAADLECFAAATELPDFIAPTWRQPERWRRLAEARLGGQTLLRLEGLLHPDAAEALREEIEALDFAEHHSAYVKGAGCELQVDALGDWLGPLTSGPLRELTGAALGVSLPARIFARAWRLGAGDSIALHKDGVHYPATLSIGLCRHWRARDGGAIAFGSPNATGLDDTERWIPHLGDALLFRPSARAWHAVEPVVDGVRYTLTAHWVGDGYPHA